MRLMGIRMSLVVISAMVAIAGCGSADSEGDGNVTTENREVTQFDSVRVSNGAELVLTVDPATAGATELSVTTDANLLEFVTTEVDSGRLRVSIDSDGEVLPTQGVVVSATTSELLDVAVSDGGEITVTASVASVTLSAANSGMINGAALEAADVEVALDNGGSAIVCARGTVSGEVANGAELTVLCGGDASGVETSTGGSLSSS